jgi:hypothetical protein
VVTAPVYRRGKFRPVPLIVTAALLVALVAGVVGATWLSTNRWAHQTVNDMVHLTAGPLALQPQGNCYTVVQTTSQPGATQSTLLRRCLPHGAPAQLDVVHGSDYAIAMAGKVSPKVAALRWNGQTYRPYHGYVIVPLIMGPGFEPIAVDALGKADRVIATLNVAP